jgi:hypothetical protein
MRNPQSCTDPGQIDFVEFSRLPMAALAASSRETSARPAGSYPKS